VAAYQCCCCHALLVRRQSESVLAGGNGDGGIQLQLDDSGIRLPAGGRLTAERFRPSTAMDSKYVIFVILFVCIQHSASYSIIIWPIFNQLFEDVCRFSLCSCSLYDYALPFKKRGFICLFYFALTQHVSPHRPYFKNVYQAVFFNWRWNLIWGMSCLSSPPRQGPRGGWDLMWGGEGKDFLLTVSYIWPWELTYPHTYHPMSYILKLFVLILSVLLLLNLHPMNKEQILPYTLLDLTFTWHSYWLFLVSAIPRG
jgi:hypothetical protein